MYYIALIIFLSAVGVVGDYFINLAGEGPKYVYLKYLILGMLIYAASGIGWFFAMKHVRLGTLGAVFSITTVLLLVFMGTVLFHEKLSTQEFAGIGAAIAAIVLLSRFF